VAAVLSASRVPCRQPSTLLVGAQLYPESVEGTLRPISARSHVLGGVLGAGVAVLQKISLASRPPSVRFLVDLAEMSVVTTVAATRASSPVCRNSINRTGRRGQGMHSHSSEDDESHKQQAGRHDANSERQVGSSWDAVRFPAIRQNVSHTTDCNPRATVATATVYPELRRVAGALTSSRAAPDRGAIRLQRLRHPPCSHSFLSLLLRSLGNQFINPLRSGITQPNAVLLIHVNILLYAYKGHVGVVVAEIVAL
jgi:hypothetical protein